MQQLSKLRVHSARNSRALRQNGDTEKGCPKLPQQKEARSQTGAKAAGNQWFPSHTEAVDI
jgi:hypothetical protein